MKDKLSARYIPEFKTKLFIYFVLIVIYNINVKKPKKDKFLSNHQRITENYLTSFFGRHSYSMYHAYDVNFVAK